MAFTATVGQKEPGPEAAGAILKGPSSSAYSAAYTAGPANAFGPGRDSSPMRRHVLSLQAERPQPHHFALGEGPKPSTHDFLSYYDKSSQHLQHGSGPVLSSSLTTQDFLQPLERGGARQAYGEASLPRIDKSVRGEAVQSHSATPAPMEHLLPTVIPNYATRQVPYRRTAGVMELPPNSVIRMIGEANEEAMRSRGYAGGAQFTQEDQNATGSDEGALDPESVTNARENLAYWSSVRLKFGLPQDLKFLANNSPAASENGGQVTAKQWTQRNEGMIEVPKRPSRGPSEDDEDEDEDSQERASGNRKISRFQKEDASQKADMKSSEIRAGTPRSKHSATEQRRRSKINDRFQMLRDLVPHSDQKRDKASFLLEVIEYIQILQDKVQKYETVEQGRHQERLKSMVWDLCKRGTGSGEEASQINALVFAKEFSPGGLPLDVKQVTEVATEMTRSRGSFLSDHVSPSEPTTGAPKVQHPSRPASSIHSCVSSLEEKESTALVAQPVAVVQVPAEQAIPPAFCRTPVQPKQQYEHISSRGAPLSNSSENDNPGDLDASHFRVNGYVPGQAPASSRDHHQFEARFRSSPSRQAEQVSQGPLSKVQPHPQLANAISRVDEAHTGVGSGSSPLRPPHEDGSGSLGTGQSQKQLGVSPSDHVSGRDGAPTSPHAPLKIQGGVINVSTAYSKGLLDTLTRALQSSGLDLAQANISVQIDLGKNSISADVDTSAKIATTPESSAQSHQSQGRTRPPPPVPEPEPVLKKPKVEAGQ